MLGRASRILFFPACLLLSCIVAGEHRGNWILTCLAFAMPYRAVLLAYVVVCAIRVVLAWFSNVGLPPVEHPQLAELHELIDKRPRRDNADDSEQEEGSSM